MASARNLVPAILALLILGGLAAAWVLTSRPGGFTAPEPADWTQLPAAARDAALAAVDACRAAPDDPAAFGTLGRIYHGNAEPALAIAAYERAITLGAEDARTPYLLALLYEDWGRTDDAVEMLGVTLDRDAAYAPAWFHLARTQLDAGDVPAAIAASRRAIELDPSGATYHAELGRALRQAGQLDEAIAALRRALALEPDHPGAHQLLGLSLRARGDHDEADRHLARIGRHGTQLVTDPWLLEAMQHAASVETRLDWVRSYIAQGRLDTALKVLRELAAAHPQRAEVFRRLGEVYARGGRTDLALEAYARVVELEPFDASTRRALAESLLLTGDLDGAEREITTVLGADPSDVDALVIRAAILLDRGDADTAARQLEAVTAQRGDHVAGHYWLGEALMTLQQYDRAVPVYERLVELRPDLASARTQLQKARRLRSSGGER